MDFNFIKFHKRAIKILNGTLHTGKIPNAFLFIGDPYLGKFETALAYAKALNCHKSTGNIEYCKECPSCKKIEKGIHPDIKIVEPERDILTINTIREIEEFISYLPLESKYKVVILKESHKMNTAAANSFLKTLEEPPLNTTIILICENVYSLPEPLVSRCFKIYFSPLPKEVIKKVIPDSENKNLIINLLMGRPGLYISRDILKDIKWFKQSLNEREIKKSPWKDNEEIKLWIDIFFVFLRDTIKNKFTTKGEQFIQLDYKLDEEITLEDLFVLFDKIQEIRKNIDLNLNKSIVWNYIEKMLRGVKNA